jgi:peptide deformylase
MNIVDPSQVENASVFKVSSSEFPAKVSTYAEISQDMIKFAKETNGVGLSAIQVGLPIHLFVAFDYEKIIWKVYFNATYCPVNESKKYPAMEACLTYGRRQFGLNRYDRVFVSWDELTKENILTSKSKLFFERTAQVLQHECDHCGNGSGKGITIKMIGQEMNV